MDSSAQSGRVGFVEVDIHSNRRKEDAVHGPSYRQVSRCSVKALDVLF